ncbi:LOW QUALITY PROTEIN: uncharacterized protein FYW49_014723 [Xenentodon cancila]
MNDAQQEMSPDFVVMRLVSAPEDDRLAAGGGFGSIKARLGPRDSRFSVDHGGPSTGSGSSFPHYSSPLPVKCELDGGLVLPQARLGSEPPEDFSAAARRFMDFSVQHSSGGSRAQLMVFQNLLRSGNRILECGLEQSPQGLLPGEEETQQFLDPRSSQGFGGTTVVPGPGACVPLAEENQRWPPILRLATGPQGTNPVPVLDPGSGLVLCHQHHLLTGGLAKWPQDLLDPALQLGLLEPLEPKKLCPPGDEDPVLVLTERMGQLGERREGGGGGSCSCHAVLASGRGDVGPGEDPSETSDALLVLEGLGTEEVGGNGDGDVGENAELGGVSGVGTAGRAVPVISSGTLSGLMQQVHRLAEEAGVCTEQTCCTSLPRPLSVETCPPQESLQSLSSTTPELGPFLSRSQPQSRAATPKVGMVSGGCSASPLVVLDREKASQRKSRKGGGSLKVRLSKLFKTKSSSWGGSGGLLDKRPSLASSTSSGGSLLDVWGSTCSNPDQDGSRLQVSRPHSTFSPVPFTPPFTGETVSLVDVDICRRRVSSLHPHTPPPPPRRSLSLLDDFSGPPQHHGPFMEHIGGTSMQSLPPRPLVLPPSLSNIQHSLSLNDTFLRGLPRPVPLRPNGQPPPPRLVPRCPLSRINNGSFATSLRELEKCGWYWGPMNWEDAEMKLKGKPDGSFLVRDSSDPRYILSLSFRSQGVTHHTRMEHYRGTFSLWCHPKFEDRCHSVVEFIDRAILHSKNGKFLYFLRSRVPGLPPTPVQLLYPVSRFSSIKSLQHLCRFCIRQLVRIDHIQELPLPKPLIAYLRKFYYYDPEEEISPTLQELKDGGQEQSRPLGAGSQT